MPLFPSFLLLLLACPALLTPSGSQSLQTGGQRAPRNTKPEGGGQPIKVVISEACVQGDSSQNQGKELDLEPGSSLVLTHRIRLVPGSCGGGCEAEFAALRDRLERLEKEVSALREKCGGPEGGCCTSQQSKGAECSMQPEGDECPNECSDQGRCEDGKCVCFPGFSGPDCSLSDCPGNCNDKGKCVNGQCVCDPGFTGPDCSSESCPGNCNNKGRCENGQCVCNTGLTGPDCSTKACPGNCNNKGRCENGQCVCNNGFTGPDCSTKACPGNCNNKGRCENGQCVCNTGFTGPDCSTKACLGNCKNRGKCVNGKCVCDSGFTGPDCSTKSCPGNCSNRGKCVNGQCVCDMGFTGPDCSAKACPNNCSNKGRCVNGKCVCEVGFTGQDCAAKGCPDNCSNKGRCVKGRCVCRRGFTAPDCSQCEAGFTGVDCGTVMSGVSQLNTKDVTESSVTLFWTPPPVQYDTYHVTFASQKEGDQQITSQVGGKLTAYTQTGLAAGQAYTVTITGEIDGRMGAESTAEFTTLISGPTNLQVVKTTTTSAVVQWEQSQGDIDRYRLTVTPNQTDGTAKGRQDLTLPPERDSAQIDGLDPGHLYDITLVAEKGGIKSKPTTVQVTPGKSTKTISKVTMPVAPGVESHEGDSAGNTKPVKDIFYTKAKGEEPERVKDWSGPGSVTVEGTNGTKEDTSVRTSTRPLVNTNYRVIPKTGDRITLPRKPYIGGSIHFNGTRVGQGGRRVGHSLLKKPTSRNPLEGPKVKKTLDTDSKPENPFVGDKTIALTVKETNLETSPLGEKDETLTKTYPVGILPVNAIPSSCSEQTVIPGLKDLPDRKKDTEIETNEPGPGTEGLEHTTTSEKNTMVHPNGKKCVNKVKLTHRKKTANVGLFGTKQNKTKTLRTLTLGSTPPLRRLPPKGTQQRRPHPNMGAFPNRTRTNLIPPQHPSRGPIRRPFPPKLTNRDNGIIVQTSQPGEQGTYSTSQNDTNTDLKPKTLLRKTNATAGKIARDQTYIRNNSSLSQRGQDSKTGHPDKGSQVSKNADSRDSPNQINGSDVTTTGKTGQPLNSVGVQSITSGGFILLSPGSSYEVSVISVLGLDESDAIKDLVMTLPDPPTDLQAINVTDTKALLLWRPALATVDRYVIVYGSEKGSDDVKITVSGNAAEQQLKDLQGSTMYTVTVTSQLGNLDGAPAITVFTTTSGSGGDGEGPRDLKASQVTPRSALLTWKPPSAAVGSYKLTYQTEGQEMQEVTIDATVTEFKLTRLHPMSKYTVQLQGERGGSYTAAISTEFTTGNLRYPFPSDCSQELLNGMHESGEVEIFPKGRQGKPVLVYCDQVTDGGGWTVFQRRMDGKTDFFRDWKNYSKGFGELSGEFWLGNENLHNLTSMAPMTLRVDLRAGDESVFAKYSTFTVDTVRRNYALKVSGYSGTAGDSMSYHNGRMFSTRDRDPAPFITRCAMSYRGGWWYKNCHQANLNGLYDTNVNHQGLIWTAWKGKDYSVPFTEMKLRPTSFTPPTQG
ncbi:tenascin-X-like [Salvelinus namaycush]|uniref:Tenascin-X-like n=1 Tax=Salvelinus namaycush TaxID=8040 RepID=A0A8U0TMJ6_SALNM|nr:tenascin-X-like [Salvelinus namaycush]